MSRRARMDLEDIVHRYYEDLYRFAFSLARNRDDACDLTQQTYAILARKRGQVRDQERIKQWLFTTLYREFLRGRQQGKRLVSFDHESADVSEPSSSPDPGQGAEHRELLEALLTLEQDHREVLSLFYLQQNPYKDIARILGIPIGTVMSRLSRAKDALRRKLGDRDHAVDPRNPTGHG